MASSYILPAVKVRHDDPPSYYDTLHTYRWVAVICLINGLTVLIIAARFWVRHKTSKRFRADDYWIAAAGLVSIFPQWFSQIGAIISDVELIFLNNESTSIITIYMLSSRGLFGYYLVLSLIKVSMCFCLLQLVSRSLFAGLRYFIFGLSAVIMGLGIAMAFAWFFRCQPIQSNFDFYAPQNWCVNNNAAKYSWLGLNVSFDLILIWIPYTILRRARLDGYIQKTLMAVFGAGLLGTIFSILRLIPLIQSEGDDEFTYYMLGVDFVLTDLEMLMFTIVVSKYIVSVVLHFTSISESREPSHSLVSGLFGPTLSESPHPYTTDNVELVEVITHQSILIPERAKCMFPANHVQRDRDFKEV
ncbi:hypothetical protein OIDMADRAFT_34761 [Oidiodendron maius Zn]|uniref:Rhodopsin domain-containing protein n=1 Tax=Oidiodendron maius (strain Zn) TaxID=913774 RepID=A0A0C3GTY4_OIDMZ|nr:hypothetical protein OIDMADRAFT_34761 [Oidiodendron maius Zn]